VHTVGRTGGGGGAAASPAEGVPELVAELLRRVPPQLRRPDGPLLHAIDHCFGIRGQGTVLTGTVLRVSPPASVFRGNCRLSS
jgi:selenocysteine-specific elongation factor